MNRYPRHFTIAALVLGFAVSAAAQTSPALKKLAVVNGEIVTDEQVKKSAAADLDSIEVRRLQDAAETARDEHAAYEKALNAIIDNRLILAEAKKRGITTEAMMTAEIGSKVVPPTDVEVDTFILVNKDRINITGDQLKPQVRAYLANQQRDKLYKDFLAGLRAEYKVESYFEPFRVDIPIDGFPFKGPAAATVTLVEFSDFECPYCGAIEPTLTRIATEYKDRVKIVFRQFPLTNLHPRARKAAEASLCAFDQNKFWELHDVMFGDQKNLEIAQLKTKAQVVGLDLTKFNACLDSGSKGDAVKADQRAGFKAGVTGTPGIFINGRFFNGVQSFDILSKAIDEELKKSPAKNQNQH